MKPLEERLGFDKWLARHDRADEIYTNAYRKTILPLRRLWWVIPNRRLRRQFKPGGFYLDHGSEPCVLIKIEHKESLLGVSMIDGRLVGGCSIFSCGPEPCTRKEAVAAAMDPQRDRSHP